MSVRLKTEKQLKVMSSTLANVHRKVLRKSRKVWIKTTLIVCTKICPEISWPQHSFHVLKLFLLVLCNIEVFQETEFGIFII